MLVGWYAQIALAWMIVVCWACLIQHVSIRGWHTEMQRFIFGLLLVKVIWWSLIGIGTIHYLIHKTSPAGWLQIAELIAFILNPVVVTYCLYLMLKYNRRKPNDAIRN